MEKKPASLSADDFAFGPEATILEKSIAWSAGLLLGAYILLLYANNIIVWTTTQLVLAFLIALDLGAGAIANALPSCRRFYHNPASSDDVFIVKILKNKLIFAALHIYPILVTLVFDPGNWAYAVGGYLLLIVSTLLVLRAPQPLQRSISFYAVLLAVLFSPWIVPAPRGFEWLMPVLVLKIVAGHSVSD